APGRIAGQVPVRRVVLLFVPDRGVDDVPGRATRHDDEVGKPRRGEEPSEVALHDVPVDEREVLEDGAWARVLAVERHVGDGMVERAPKRVAEGLGELCRRRGGSAGQIIAWNAPASKRPRTRWSRSDSERFGSAFALWPAASITAASRCRSSSVSSL